MKMKPQGDWLLFMDSECANSAYRALEWHLTSSSLVPETVPLFAFEMLNGSWCPIHKTWFLAQCNSVWSSHFPSPISGHLFRIGGTTHLLLLGIDPFIVMVQGHWSSNAFLTYWHKCKEIIPLSIGFSLDSHSSILSTMSHFKVKLLNK